MKHYFTLFMAHALYTLGDLVSKPLNWGWANSDKDNGLVEWLVHINYSTYNFLMLQSVNFNDAGGHDVWQDADPMDDEDDENDDDPGFQPIVFTKKDEK